jgi:hypothetical protein
MENFSGLITKNSTFKSNGKILYPFCRTYAESDANERGAVWTPHPGACTNIISGLSKLS